MPTVVELGNVQIRVYPSDHPPPYFHISTPYGEAMMRIADLVLIKGRLKRSDLNKVIEWAEQNRRLIQDEWLRNNERG